ncbi:MAG TPA: hypothetical protein VN228_20595 [Pyrinomonadaceae bacterium]|nr:hypothetical protein [Pyrinomonadaceae bacterium]
MNNCARCGQGNGSAADFCARCGLPLGASGRVAVAPAYGPAVAAGSLEGTIPFDFPARRLRSAADALAPTFQLYRSHYDAVAKVVLAAALPQAALEYTMTRVAVSPWEPDAFSMLASVASSSLMTVALVYSVMTLLRTGASPPLAESYAWGLRKWWRGAACWLLVTALTWAGTLLLVAPGLILMTVFAVALPAVAAEDLGPLDALKRSAALTRGYRGRVFAALLVMTLAACGAVWLTTGFAAPQFEAGSSLLVSLAYAAVSQVIWSAFTVLSLFTYLGIRADRGEGVAPAATAAQP